MYTRLCQPLISDMRTRRWFSLTLHLAHTTIVTLTLIICVTIYITIFGENKIGRQIAKSRHIEKPSTSQMQDPLGMICV